MNRTPSTGVTMPYKFNIGDEVEVSTTAPGPTCRDSAGGWGFKPGEWRLATISGQPMTPDRTYGYSVQFRPDDCHWSFSEHEIRVPLALLDTETQARLDYLEIKRWPTDAEAYERAGLQSARWTAELLADELGIDAGAREFDWAVA